MLLEAADILAWEWAKHVERVENGIKARPSLDALIAAPDKPLGKSLHYESPKFRAMHFPRSALAVFLEKIRKYVLDDDAEVHPLVLEAMNQARA